MENSSIALHKVNQSLKQSKFKRWALEYDDEQQRYCLSVFDNYNSEDEILVYLHSMELEHITHAIRYKGNGSQTTISKRHYLYKQAEEIITNFILPNATQAA